MRRCFPFLVLTVALVACQDRTRTPGAIVGVEQPDLGVVVDASFDEPVRALCSPGSRRCVAENSPMIERCGPDGIGFEPDTCEDGNICREGECVAFSCVPGRPLCVGATARAVCDDSGRAVRDTSRCEAANICLGGTCVDPCAEAEAAGSYITCEYVAHDVPNLHQELGAATEAPFAVVVANPAPLVSATVSITAGGEPATLRGAFTLEPGPGYALGEPTDLDSELLLADGTRESIPSTSDLEVPAGAAAVFLLDRFAGADVYRIVSSRPVVAYQFSPYCCNFTATNDASLLLPASAWGTRYRAVGYPAWKLGDEAQYEHGYVSLLATEPTTVQVRAPVPMKNVGSFEASRNFEVTLQPGAPMVIETADPDTDTAPDLSGLELEGDVPFGVIVGHPCTFVPQDEWACDHLEEFLLPASILGKRYIFTPVRRRSEPDEIGRDSSEATYWRLVADEDVELTFEPPLDELDVLPPSAAGTSDCRNLAVDGVIRLDEGSVCEFGTTDAVAVQSTGPLVVAGVISGHQSTGVDFYGTQAGDPSLFILPPVEQFRSDYTFVTPPTFQRTYATVAAEPGTPVTLDGRALPQEQRLERRTVQLGNREWEIFTVALEPGVHRVASENRFGLIVYAYDDYVSYAFTGGLDLLPKGAANR